MQSTASITEQDLRYLVCPVCHAALRLEVQRAEASTILCVGCGRRYPIVDGLPVLLAERAL
jgi:uncharacterized protein YbaR (Trm112 family)